MLEGFVQKLTQLKV